MTTPFPLLDTPIERNDFCPNCQCARRFVAYGELANGLWEVCVQCGEERITRYTHTVAEVPKKPNQKSKSANTRESTA